MLKNIKSILAIILSLTFVAPLFIFAQSGGAGATINNPISATDFTSLLKLILQIVTEIGAIVVVIFIIYSGFLFVTARGNEEKISEAKRALTWTLIGAAILLGANAIALAVQGTVTSLS